MCVPFHLVDILKSNDRCADYVLMTQRSSKQLNEYSLNMQTSHVRVFNSFCLDFACVSIVFFYFDLSRRIFQILCGFEKMQQLLFFLFCISAVVNNIPCVTVLQRSIVNHFDAYAI